MCSVTRTGTTWCQNLRQNLRRHRFCVVFFTKFYVALLIIGEALGDGTRLRYTDGWMDARAGNTRNLSPFGS